MFNETKWSKGLKVNFTVTSWCSAINATATIQRHSSGTAAQEYLFCKCYDVCWIDNDVKWHSATAQLSPLIRASPNQYQSR